MADRNADDQDRGRNPTEGEAGRGTRGSSGYGWGFEEQGYGDWGWQRQEQRRRGPDASPGDAWGGQGDGTHRGGGFVNRSWEPGGRYDEESGRLEEQRRRGRGSVGGYGQGGGGDEAGYGGFSGSGNATTGVFGYDQENRGATFEGANPGFGGYGTGGGGYTPSRGGGTSGLDTNTGTGTRQGTGPHAGRGPQGWKPSDDRIRDQACEILTRHGHIDASGIRLTVENGEITLEGTVGSRREKRLAEEVLDDLYGVNDVHNRLRVQAE
jgi:hypothetical protein